MNAAQHFHVECGHQSWFTHHPSPSPCAYQPQWGKACISGEIAIISQNRYQFIFWFILQRGRLPPTPLLGTHLDTTHSPQRSVVTIQTLYVTHHLSWLPVVRLPLTTMTTLAVVILSVSFLPGFISSRQKYDFDWRYFTVSPLDENSMSNFSRTSLKRRKSY